MKAIFKSNVLPFLIAAAMSALTNSAAQAKAVKKAPPTDAAQESKADFGSVDSDFATKQAAGEDTPLDAKLIVNPEPVAGGTTTSNPVASLPGTVVAAAAPPEIIDKSSVLSDLPKPAIETKAEINRLPENQIPVLIDAKATKKSSSGGFARIMITLGILTGLLGATTFALKRWAKKKGTTGSSTKIRVLTQHALGPKKSIAIIQVAGESILVGITDHNISMLKTLALIDDEVPEETPRRFDTALDEFDDADEEPVAPSRSRGRREIEEFAMRGISEIRDTVSARIRKGKSV